MADRRGWRIAGSSVTGVSHAARGEECQDRHHAEETPEGALIAIASDGAGSARYAGEGASILCSAVAGAIRGRLRAIGTPACSSETLGALCRGVRDGVRFARAHASAIADERGAGIDDFHATLVGGVMLPGSGGLMFHIGDGAALAMTADGERWQMSAPRNGEFADTTFFFTDPLWWRSLRFAKVDPAMDMLFVMTDGVTDLALQHAPGGQQPFMPFFQPIGRHLAERDRDEGERALAATLESPNVCARTTDDKTLVWAMRARA